MTPGSGTVVDARTSLALWLRDGRARKRLSLDDVARITKIQPRILDKLERGELDGLPAEVFVKGFVRSFARCVGLDETEALDRYTACRNAPPRAHVNDSGPIARALVATMSELAPETARQDAPDLRDKPIEVVEIVEVGPIHSEVSIQPPAVEHSNSELPIVDISLTDMPVLGESNPELPILETAAAVETPAPAQTTKKKRSRKKAASTEAATVDGEAKPKRTRSRKKKIALGTPHEATPVVAAPVEQADAPIGSDAVATEPPGTSVETTPADTQIAMAAAVETSADDHEVVIEMTALEPPADATETPIDVLASDSTTTATDEPGATHGTWKPTMPPLPATPSVPWRRPSLPAATLPVTPSLVIDDADPDRAEREQDERAAAREPHRVSFLPPILLDREDRSARQGGLTLAVIILLIAATLTLSYLMRRPSVSGDGVTMRDVPASLA
jgi:hypothetical protein